jgi:hypothetical protein
MEYCGAGSVSDIMKLRSKTVCGGCFSYFYARVAAFCRKCSDNNYFVIIIIGSNISMTYTADRGGNSDSVIVHINGSRLSA